MIKNLCAQGGVIEMRFPKDKIEIHHILPQSRPLEYIMPVGKLPIPLPQHIHRNTKQTDPNLNTPENHKHPLEPPLQNPLIGIISQHKREQVLEYDEAGKCLDGDFSMCVE